MKIRVDINLEPGLQEYAPEQSDNMLPEIPVCLQLAPSTGCHEPEPAGPEAGTATRVH